MNFGDDICNNLRQKLDALGYQKYQLPLAAIPLVGALFEDLVKTTESLRDSKSKIAELLEEKSCWELGVEPYKCDNAKLLEETTRLRLELIKQKEAYEEQLTSYARKIRNLELDKNNLEDHCSELECQLRVFNVKYSDPKQKKNGKNMSKKPFVSTVKSGNMFPNPPEDLHTVKCTKCNSVAWAKHVVSGSTNARKDIEKLQNDLRDKSDQLLLYRKKIEERDREIQRLSELLIGGRPPTALAKDCCYKNVGTLNEDLDKLQREKAENLQNLSELQSEMHEAKKRALELAEKNKDLEKQLEKLKETALAVEDQANVEICKKEVEISRLKNQLKIGLTSENYASSECSSDERRKLNEKVNELVLRGEIMMKKLEKKSEKNKKLKEQITKLQKSACSKCHHRQLPPESNDEAKIRLKSERDIFQKEYLRLLEKSANSKEVEILKNELKEKVAEIENLRSELHNLQAELSSRCLQEHHRLNSGGASSSISVQAAILRAERERDSYKCEFERLKSERDTLREELQSSNELHLRQINCLENQIDEMNSKIHRLQAGNRELEANRIPGQTHLTLMREEVEELRKRVSELQMENSRLNISYNQLKILQEQTEKSLVEYQNKLVVCETNLRNAESRLCSVDTDRESASREVSALRNEIAVLKTTNTTLEHEKDKILSELDEKTEKLYKIELDVKLLTRKKKELETCVQSLQDKLEKVSNDRKVRESELHESSSESKSLRQQISCLRESRDKAISDNGRLSNELSDCRADILNLKRKLKESEKEIDGLKQQLQQYVQKVKRAEDLLLQKEKEREEMLDHYRHLSHDAIVLEGNNQSLELEATEYKRQLCEAEEEISKLKQELTIKEGTIQKLENQISSLSSQICSSERELDQAYDDQKILKADLQAMKELCEKLDLQSEKQNAELKERGDIITKLEQELADYRLRSGGKSGCGSRKCDKAAADVLDELLSKTRSELEEERKAFIRLQENFLETKREYQEIKEKYNREQERAQQKEALATEYRVQLNEIQHNLCDERFRQARSRENSPRSEEKKNKFSIPELRSISTEPVVTRVPKMIIIKGGQTSDGCRQYWKRFRAYPGCTLPNSNIFPSKSLLQRENGGNCYCELVEKNYNETIKKDKPDSKKVKVDIKLNPEDLVCYNCTEYEINKENGTQIKTKNFKKTYFIPMAACPMSPKHEDETMQFSDSSNRDRRKGGCERLRDNCSENIKEEDKRTKCHKKKTSKLKLSVYTGNESPRKGETTVPEKKFEILHELPNDLTKVTKAEMILKLNLDKSNVIVGTEKLNENVPEKDDYKNSVVSGKDNLKAHCANLSQRSNVSSDNISTTKKITNTVASSKCRYKAGNDSPRCSEISKETNEEESYTKSEYYREREFGFVNDCIAEIRERESKLHKYIQIMESDDDDIDYDREFLQRMREIKKVRDDDINYIQNYLRMRIFRKCWQSLGKIQEASSRRETKPQTEVEKTSNSEEKAYGESNTSDLELQSNSHENADKKIEENKENSDELSVDNAYETRKERTENISSDQKKNSCISTKKVLSKCEPSASFEGNPDDKSSNHKGDEKPKEHKEVVKNDTLGNFQPPPFENCQCLRMKHKKICNMILSDIQRRKLTLEKRRCSEC